MTRALLVRYHDFMTTITPEKRDQQMYWSAFILSCATDVDTKTSTLAAKAFLDHRPWDETASHLLAVLNGDDADQALQAKYILAHMVIQTGYDLLGSKAYHRTDDEVQTIREVLDILDDQSDRLESVRETLRVWKNSNDISERHASDAFAARLTEGIRS